MRLHSLGPSSAWAASFGPGPLRQPAPRWLARRSPEIDGPGPGPPPRPGDCHPGSSELRAGYRSGLRGSTPFLRVPWKVAGTTPWLLAAHFTRQCSPWVRTPGCQTGRPVKDAGVSPVPAWCGPLSLCKTADWKTFRRSHECGNTRSPVVACGKPGRAGYGFVPGTGLVPGVGADDVPPGRADEPGGGLAGEGGAATVPTLAGNPGKTP